MKILIIGTPYSGAKILLNGISKQGWKSWMNHFYKKKIGLVTSKLYESIRVCKQF